MLTLVVIWLGLFVWCVLFWFGVFGVGCCDVMSCLCCWCFVMCCDVLMCCWGLCLCLYLLSYAGVSVCAYICYIRLVAFAGV